MQLCDAVRLTDADATTRVKRIEQHICALGERVFGTCWSGYDRKDGLLRIQRARKDVRMSMFSASRGENNSGPPNSYLFLNTKERNAAKMAEKLADFCHDAPGALQPRLITRVAIASGNFHAAIPILEWIAKRFHHEK